MMNAQKIGRYEVRSELGRGGMATVYHAYDPNFERDVAIKVLPEVFLHDPQFRARFEREAKTIALLEHPAIVPVYDFGESNGQPYIVMRYMSGGTLGDRLRQGALSLDETARLINRLSPALDAAHARGIIHRDIKPGNILFDQYGNAFLSDFGIAHLGAEGLTNLTGASALGTPAYMSPEQIQGDGKVDGRSDIYALGVLVYQMLTGQMPYSADTPAKVMMMHVLQPVPQILATRPDLPIGCDAIIVRAMAKEPNDRFATAGELAEALDSTARYSTPGSGMAPMASSGLGGEPSTALIQPTSAAQATMKSPSSVQTVAAAGALPQAPTKKGGLSSGALIGIGLTVLALIAGLVWMVSRSNGGSPAMQAQASTQTLQAAALNPTEPEATTAPTEAEPVVEIAPSETPTLAPTQTPTLEPTATVTPTMVASAPVVGGADKVAYLDGNNIWMADLDGNNRIQLTTDGAEKWDLQWSSDGNSIFYVTGKCVQSVNIETTAVDNINCFNFIDTFKAFRISSAAEQVAIGIDNQLYVVPFDLEKLRLVKRRSELTDMAACKEFAPFEKILAEGAKWSRDDQLLAILLLANLGSGKQGNIIQIFDISQCVANPRKLNTFPGATFTLENYDKNADIQNFGFDGLSLFVLNNDVRNGGFGDLYAYNADLSKSYPKINPNDGRCCYRDAQFSPDGSHIIFAYQDFLQGASSTTKLYLVPYGSIGTGAQFTPLPLPDILNAKEKPQPILRPAR